MGRKFSLTQEVLHTLQKSRLGSANTRRSHEHNALRIVNDLLAAKVLPNSLQTISESQIIQLVKFWQQHGIKQSTICNRLATLRHLNALSGLKLPIPTNKQLHLARSPLPCQLASEDFDNLREKVTSATVQSIIALQCHFGLRKFEAFRIDQSAHQDSTTLIINRLIAHNQRSRIIPILSKAQSSVLERHYRLGRKAPLASPPITERILSELYKGECLVVGIDPNTPFHHQYVKKRFCSLLKKHSHQEGLNILSSEMGLSNPKRLEDILR